jgi:hypothetical protein
MQVLGAVLFGTLAATATHAERVPMAVMGKGKFMTKEECAALPQAVWIKVMRRDICMRYYLSTAGGQGSRAVVFLQGDAPSTRDVDTDDLVKNADRISKTNKTTGIYLARLGRDGSSGSLADRHTQLEVHATNAALDAI